MNSKHFTFPNASAGRTIVRLALAVIIASALTWLVGENYQNYLPANLKGSGGWKFLCIAGTGWTIQIALVLAFMRAEKWSYLHGLSVIMVGGIVLLCPTVIFSYWLGFNVPALPIVNILLSSTTMFIFHFRLIKKLHLTQLWTVSWFSALQITAALWAIYFFGEYILLK